MDMIFYFIFFKYMSLITYVTSIQRTVELKTVGEGGADSLSYTRENLKERWNK